MFADRGVLCTICISSDLWSGHEQRRHRMEEAAATRGGTADDATDEQFAAMFATLDSDRDGRLSVEEVQVR